ncbi:copper oxidase [Candidatus Woesearchaeota archaeon]|nr:copper oxidase [Candidatus Woesearchaeota archaeon]
MPVVSRGEKRAGYELIEGVKVFKLTAKPVRWEILPGVVMNAFGYNGQVPGPEIRVQEGDRVRIIIKNELPVPTTIHWHGVHVPNSEDGVPEVTQPAIKPGETYTYEFIANPPGTHSYHTHGPESAEQLDKGLYGAFIIEPKNPGPYDTGYDREYTLTLDEWTKTGGHSHHIDDYVYFTINGKAFPATEPLIVKQGERIKLRWANMGQQDHPMHIHGHAFTVTHRDGFPLAAPFVADTLNIAPGEHYDLELVANNPGTWVYHCHNLHHVGNDGKEMGGLVLVVNYE